MSILLNTQGWQGDYVRGSTVNILFSTSSPAAGQASPLVSGVIAVYKGTTTSNSGAGITLTAQTSGINYVAVNTAADTNFFQTGNDYTVILQAGTVSGFAVSGIVIGSFSLINRSDNLIITQNGTASAGGASSITLQANASSVPNFYNNQTVVLTVGTGAGQSAVIQSYASGTHVATITGSWATTPASGTGYVVYGGGINTANVQQINNATAVTSSAQFGVNIVTVGGAIPNPLVTGLFPASTSGGAISTVANIASGVNVTQWLGNPPNPLVTGLVAASASGGSISTAAAITSGVSVTLWQGSPPNPLVSGLVPTSVSGMPTVIISQTFPANFSSLAITSGTGLVTVGTNNDKTGYSLTSGEETNIANAVWDQASGIETNVTPRQALRYTAAANVGVTSGALTTTFTVSAMSAAGTTRITATTDSSGNRSAVVLS